MKIFLTIVFLTCVAFVIRQKQDRLVLPDSSETIFAEQQIQLGQSSFGPLYMHVFEIDKIGPVKHVNLTDQLKNETMSIVSFEYLEDEGTSTWVAYLKRTDDDRVYVCELEEALKAHEIKLLK